MRTFIVNSYELHISVVATHFKQVSSFRPGPLMGELKMFVFDFENEAKIFC